MFETSQQEQGSGSGKIVGGVIAVVAVVLVVVYFLFLHGQPQSTPETRGAATRAADAAATGEKPDPAKDLSIVKSNLRRDTQTQTMAMWDIQVANRNKGYGYKDIHYATTYYNAQNDVLRQGGGTLGEQVDPGDQHSYSVNDGLYPVGTVRYTVELKDAAPVQP
jgi:hypothetical protein